MALAVDVFIYQFIHVYIHVCIYAIPSHAGALTRTIVATKERLEGSLPPEEGPTHPGISEAQRRKERELIAREVRDTAVVASKL